MRLADLSLRADGSAVVATVSGEVDMSNAAELQAALSDGTPNSATALILDLSRLDYLDSAGIQLLLRLQAALRTRAQTLVLVVPDDSIVADTFRLAGVSEHVEIAPSVEAAMQALPAESSTLD